MYKGKFFKEARKAENKLLKKKQLYKVEKEQQNNAKESCRWNPKDKKKDV